MVQIVRLANGLDEVGNKEGKKGIKNDLGIWLEHLGEWPRLLLRCGILVKGCVW